MQLPPEHLWKTLDPQVRALYWVGALANEYPISKRMVGYFHRHVTDRWIDAITQRSLHGLENLPTDRPVMMVCNHRTFFDYYLICSRLMRVIDPPPPIFFPVRSKFFYEKPLGGLLNAAVGGYTMYPPIFRKDSKGLRDPELRRDLNRYAVDRCVELLSGPEPAMLGFHPEGRRNEDPDPYNLLPPKPGAGEIAHRSKTTVVPIFVINIDSSFANQVRRRFDRNEGPVRIYFGAPLELDDLYAQEASPEVNQALLDRMMGGIRALAEQDRQMSQ